MKRETNQRSHMLFWPKMVSDGGVLLLEQHCNKVQFGWVQTGSAKSCHPLNFKPDHRTSSATGLNFQTGPGSGSARFRFELWFRTKPWHHYVWWTYQSIYSHHYDVPQDKPIPKAPPQLSHILIMLKVERPDKFCQILWVNSSTFNKIVEKIKDNPT